MFLSFHYRNEIRQVLNDLLIYFKANIKGRVLLQGGSLHIPRRMPRNFSVVLQLFIKIFFSVNLFLEWNVLVRNRLVLLFMKFPVLLEVPDRKSLVELFSCVLDR